MLCLSRSMAAPTPCLLLLLLSGAIFSEAGTIGVNFGRVANNLPSAPKVVELLKSEGINQVRIFDTDPTVLKAFSGTGIKVLVTLPNELLAAAAARPAFAAAWVQRNVSPYYPSTAIHTIAVGNEVFADLHNRTSFLIPAMKNVYNALVRLHLDGVIKVSTSVALSALQASYPPSAGAFRSDLAEAVMKPMLEFLRSSGSYLMVNAYPFLAYEANSDVISLDYALFRPNAGVIDPATGLKYYSLFDAQIDAVFYAMAKLKCDNVKIVVSETGWPSKGEMKETGAGAANAAAFNGNLVRRVLSGNAGTPSKPNADIDVYLFALFNENQKPGPTSERNFGLFYPNEEKVYDIAFTLGGSGGGGRLGWQEQNGKGRVFERTTGGTWCVANPNVGEKRLQAALDYACGEGGADCKPVQPGAACYYPNTLQAHASYAFNSYYQKKARVVGTCDFQGAAYVVSQPPRIGNCVLPYGA